MNIRLTIVTVLGVSTALWAMPGTARGQTPTATPGDLFTSINGPMFSGQGSIFQYTQAGPPHTIFGPSIPSPRGLVFDNAGNLFVTTTSFDNSGTYLQGAILKIKPDGTATPFAPPPPPATGFGTNVFMQAVVFYGGNLFVMVQHVDPITFDFTTPSTIYKVTADGTASDGTVSILGSIAGSIGLGLAFDSAGNLYAADSGTQTIWMFPSTGGTLSGTPTPFADSSKFNSVGVQGGPGGLAFDSAGNLFVSTGFTGNDAIVKFTPDGNPTVFFSGLANGPRGIAFDSAGNLFVAEVGFGSTNNLPNLGDVVKLTPGATETFVDQNIGTQNNRGPEYLDVVPGWSTTTSAGSNVTTPAGTVGFATISLTFPSVSPPGGTTTVTPVSPSSAGYTLPGSSLAFDITTTATYTTPITIAFQVARPLDVSQLTVYHNVGGNLVNVTCPSPQPGPTPDLTTNTIYASVTSLSPFVIAQLPFTAQVQQPVNSDGSSVFTVKRGVVPVKFTLAQNGASTCTLPPATIAVTRTAGGTTGAVDESVYTGSADTGSNFRISSCQYVYNLSSSALGPGTYRVDIKINGVPVGSATFALQ